MIIKYAFETSGEKLLYHVQTALLQNVDWNRLSTGLLACGRAEELTKLFREIAVVNTTCRLVQAAKSIRIDRDGNNRLTTDPSYLSDLKRFLRELMLVPDSALESTIRLAVSAAQAAASSISDRTRKQMSQEASNRNTPCYLCDCELDYSLQDKIRKFDLEHIWPKSFGGDSVPENLLPVCHGCNQQKRDLATWGMAGVQSLILGLSPNEEALKLRGEYSFALHYYAARRLLENYPQKSLKWAMLRLGPRQKFVRVIDPNHIADYFNLENHNPSVRL